MKVEDELEIKEKEMAEEELMTLEDAYDSMAAEKAIHANYDEELEENIESKQEDAKYPYEYIEAYKLEENEKPLNKVVGLENQKEELLNVINWFKRSKELKAKGISIPRAALLFGPAGCGKSLLLKEMIK